MQDIVANPMVVAAFLGAFAAVFGAVLGGKVTRKRDAGETALKALGMLVEKQESSISKLEKRVDAMEALENRHRRLSEKYSVAIAYILTMWTSWRGLKVRLTAHGFAHGEPPPIPEIIAVDMLHPPEPTDDLGGLPPDPK